MAEEKPEDTGPPPESGRVKREPPTIDLEASEVSSETRAAASDSQPTEEMAQENPSEAISSEQLSSKELPPEVPPAPVSAPVSSWVVAPLSGAVAGALVIGLGWMLGWPTPAASPTVAAPQVNSAALDDLTARVASVETKTSKPPVAAPDPAAAARIEALEKSLASLRGELTAARAQSEKLAAALAAATAAPRDGSAPVDLTAINERIAQIERTTKAQGAEIAQESAKPVDDMPLRRVVAATLLDVLVRTGDPYPSALAAAKSLAPNADALKPLAEFVTTGVPSAARLSGELLTLVPKLSPPVQETAATGTGIVDRLQAGAAKLVRIERTDTVGNDRGAVVARITAAALRNDSNEARRELKTLAPADRAAAQAWLDKADARDAALAASRQFAADAMSALAKPAQ